MRIAQVAPLYESVPPKLYGGTERVVSYLTEELVRLGHDVTLFASGDSTTAAKLVAAASRALRLDPRWQEPLVVHLRMLGWVYERAHEFDVIHCHTDFLGLPLTRFVSTPTVVTLHGRLDIPGLDLLYGEYADVPLISISDAQRLPLRRATWLATVHHGLPRSLYRCQTEPGCYLLFLGRISPEKCPDAAIRIAQAARVPLKIAAKVDSADRAYFEAVVRPLLGQPGVEFLGEVDDRQKEELLRGALALLFPVDWPEPFGLVIIEALACGTPVIARRRGSVPEILRDGVTGFICETEEEMVQAVWRIQQISRHLCRHEFESRFAVETMAQKYLDAYRVLLDGRADIRHARGAAIGVARNNRLRVGGTADDDARL